MTAVDAIRAITGRDVRGIMDHHLTDVEHLIFVPSLHVGPYLSDYREGSTMKVLFRARLPEGVRSRSPEFTRSDLLVRLSALADDTRLRILELMTAHEELCSQEIIDMLDLSQSAASRHLRQLTATGYLTERRVEGAKCYRLNPQRVEDTLSAISAFLLKR
jgi:DNA-binding transcriptional ArsR family regulator